MNYIIKSIRAVVLLAFCFSLFGLAPQAFATPAVLTTPATSVTQTTATLNGTVTSSATSVDVRFEWGTTPLLGQFTTYQTITAPGGTAHAVSAPITFTQTAGNSIYYKIMAVETGGSGTPFAWGTNLSFVVPAYATPIVLTSPAVVGASTVTLAGFVNPNGTTVTAGIQYANNNTFVGSTLVGVTTISSVNNFANNVTATVPLSSFVAGQTYYFRVYAINGANQTTNGNTLNFVATANPPVSTCTIASFSGNPGTITIGSSATLSWSLSGAGCSSTMITSNGSNQTVTGQTNLTVTPSTTTTYTLTSTDTAGVTTTATTTITVNTNGGSFCMLSSFYPASQTVSSGSTTILYWNASNCQNLTLSGGGMNNNVSGLSSYTTPTIYGNTTFTLSGVGLNGITNTIQTTVSTTTSGNYCAINNFNAANTSVLQGSSTTLSWNTNNCTTVSLSGVGVYSYQTSGSVQTGILYTTTTYTLTASNGTNSTSQSVTVGVYSTPLPPNPPYYPPMNNQTLQVMTGAATNVFLSSARLNGFAGNMNNSTTTGYFEYGTNSSSLIFTTLAQNLGYAQSTGFYDTASGLEPNTFYYYRAVATSTSGTIRGDIRFFKTTPEALGPNYVTRYVDRPTYIDRGVGEDSSQAQMSLNVVGDLKCDERKMVTYVLTYKNTSTDVLRNGTITVTLPNDVTFASTSAGAYDMSRHVVTIPVNALTAGSTNTVNIAGVYSGTTKNKQSVHEYGSVSATYEYTYGTNKPGTARTFIASPLNRCADTSLFAGLAFWGDGFWPATIIGWIILLFLVLLAILVVRTLATRPGMTFQKRSY